jgi:hypothetical protein
MYRFGPFDVPYPESGSIPIGRCGVCGLLYKTLVPHPADLRRLLAEVASKVWVSHGYDYQSERDSVLRFVTDPTSVDVIDIGGSEGDLLAAFDGVPGRRSALDAVRNERCARRVSNEYILQYLEDPLHWHGQPYDIVLAFDIFEHLYRPAAALSNLALLTRHGGVLVVQTGNAGYVTSGLRDWWYLNLFEHHLVWTAEALALAARRAGFRIERIEAGSHKDSRHMPAWKRAGVGVLRALSRVPCAVAVSLALTSYDPQLVAEIGADDHFTAFLRREEAANLQ